ncbi:MAG TPA: MaoC/PaaZ C-terminal domain-containing protein [Syntrophales bacterium]|nr:MaoC/PaaZ C-terminal domain-containing protein [Syntrophales bacterium]
MALDLSSVGREIGPLVHRYTRRDVMLYGLAVGAGPGELDYCFEKGLKVLPTFVLGTTFDFFWALARETGIDTTGILHGEQDLVLHETLPVEGAFLTRGRVTAVSDKGAGRGALVIGSADSRDEGGRLLATNTYTLFALKDGGSGSRGELPARETVVFPERPPDHVIDDVTGPAQNLLYRLTGDYFHLHADPGIARAAGFVRPIMHGACFLGYGCRALIGAATPGRPDRVRRIAARFARPLYPGTPVRTLAWSSGAGRALWRMTNGATGETVIDRGVFEYDTSPET